MVMDSGEVRERLRIDAAFSKKAKKSGNQSKQNHEDGYDWKI